MGEGASGERSVAHAMPPLEHLVLFADERVAETDGKVAVKRMNSRERCAQQD